jgi:hypothetical protein
MTLVSTTVTAGKLAPGWERSTTLPAIQEVVIVLFGLNPISVPMRVATE